MTTPASSSVNRDSGVTYAGMKDKQDSNKLTRKESSENRAIYKNVCHIKSPSLEVKRTSSEVGSRIGFESDMDTKILIHRSKSTKSSVKGETIKKAIAILESNKSTIIKSTGGQSVSRTPSNKLSDLDHTKLQGRN